MELTERQRRCDPTVPPPRDDPEIESALDQIRYSLRWAREEELGSDDALAQFAVALATLARLFRNHLQAAFPRPIEGPHFQADAERALSLFVAAEGFLGAMALELSYSLAGLQVGEVRPSVKPRSRRGGVSQLEDLTLKGIIVGAADRLKARGGGDAAYRCELKERGLNSRSVETYRRQIARTQVTKRPIKFVSDELMDVLIVWARDRLRKSKKPQGIRKLTEVGP